MLGSTDRILVATDFSPDSQKAVGCARDLAHRFGVEALLLHVRPEGPVPAARDAVGDLLSNLESIVDSLRDRCVRARGILGAGDPAAEILRVAARERASLIVIGARGVGAAAGLLLGSVADRVVRRAATPLLLVRSDSTGTAKEPCAGGRHDGQGGEPEAGP